MNTSHDTPAGGSGSHPADPSIAEARKRRLFRWGAGITLAGFLAGGGIALAVAAGTSASGSPAAGTLTAGSPAAGTLTAGSPAAGTLTAGSPAAGTQGAQGAVLNSALSDAAAPGSATVPAARVRWALGRLRRLGGIHGEFTVRYDGGYRMLAFERGTIQSVSGGDVVIKAPDGTTWTWLIVSDTVVRKNGAKTMTSALAAGETAFAGGPVADGARDARLIVIRKAAGSSGSSGSSAPTGSGSAQSSLR